MTSDSKPMSIFELPQDVIFDILSRVPTKSLIHFRCVCTSAPPLISHPSFINLHLSASANVDRTLIYYESIDFKKYFYSLRSPVTFQETLQLHVPYEKMDKGYRQIVGSSKGLICLFYTNFASSYGTLILWNPSIHKFKVVDGPHSVRVAWSHYAMGFGFVSRTSEFKVVKIVYNTYKSTSTVLVYSLTTKSWNQKEDVSAPFMLPSCWSRNVLVNGFVNWLALKDQANDSSSVIMAFDLDHERFQLLELPKNIAVNRYGVKISSYGDDASLSLSLCAYYGEKWNVWVMGDYGLVDSWKKLFVVSLPKILYSPPLLMKNEHQVLIVVEGGKLMLLDAIKNEVQDLKTQGSPNFFHAVRYNASLAPLHGLRA